MSRRNDRSIGRLVLAAGGLVVVIAVLAAAFEVPRGFVQPQAAPMPSVTTTDAPAPAAPTPPSTQTELETPTTQTERSDAPIARLAVVGDVGTGDQHEWETAGFMVESGASDPFDALILLGDNVYPNGDPERLDATVFDPFAPILEAGADLLAVLGNHDVRNGNGPGQVARLGMPHNWYSVQIGPVLLIGLDSNRVDDAAQLRWLEETLAEATVSTIIAAMHHPAYSAGYHGSTPNVQEVWVPLFEQHGVDLVLAGHDHDYQRSVPIGGVTYFVSGGGAKLRPAGTAEFSAYTASVRHFLDVQIWDDRIEVAAIGADGPFDHVTIRKTPSGALER